MISDMRIYYNKPHQGEGLPLAVLTKLAVVSQSQQASICQIGDHPSKHSFLPLCLFSPCTEAPPGFAVSVNQSVNILNSMEIQAP